MGLTVKRFLSVALIGLCVALVGAVLVIDVHPSAGRAEGRTLLVLGDSLTYGTDLKIFGNVSPQLKALETFDVVKVDGVHARNISGPARTSRNGVKTYVKLIKDGLRPSAVIVALGSNDLQQSYKPAFFEAEIRELLAVIGDIPVVWINSQGARSAAISAKLRPLPSRVAVSPAKACQRLTATST